MIGFLLRRNAIRVVPDGWNRADRRPAEGGVPMTPLDYLERRAVRIGAIAKASGEEG